MAKNIRKTTEKTTFPLHFNKNAKIICSVKYSVEFSNDFVLVLTEWIFENAAAEKKSFSTLFVVAFCITVICVEIILSF